MLWLNSWVGLLLPVAMAHMHDQLEYVMLCAKDNTKHTLWDSQSHALMALQMLCKLLVQIALRHAHTSPCLLLVAPLKVLTNVNVTVLAQSEE